MTATDTLRTIIQKQAQQIIRLTRAVDHLGTELDTARLEVAELERKLELVREAVK